jgi:mRNA interferase MazF
MTPCDPGDVVLVRFPFSDLVASKKRPVLVLSPRGYGNRYGDVVVLALTSQDSGDEQFALQNWQQAGLPKPTWFKPLIATITSRIIDRRLGTLSAEDLPRAVSAIRYSISPEFLA